MQEFLDLTKETDIGSISIEQSSMDNFSLRITSQSRSGIKAFIEPIVVREKLIIKEQNGSFIVCSQD